MTVPRLSRTKETSEGILALIAADLGTEFSLNSREPTYYGHPIFVANYPCLVAVPHTSGMDMRTDKSPIWGDFTINHRIVYIFEGDRPYDADAADPYPESQAFGDRLVDWLCYAVAENKIPLIDPDGADIDTNWLFDMYLPPWYCRISNEYQSALATARAEHNLYAPMVEFGTKMRRYLAVA